MKRIVILQARMTSTRLPGKILMDLCGAPMLSRQIDRLRRCRLVDDIVVATTRNDADRPVVGLAEALGIRPFCGSEDDVLSRLAGASRDAAADVVVRITGDCPLIDPRVTDSVITALMSGDCDYASNVLDRTFPRGLDAEAMWADVLDRTDRLARSVSAREHVTTFIHSERPDLFITRSVRANRDDSDLRWTVDIADDLALIRRLYEDLDLARCDVPYEQIVDHVRAHPEIADLNAHVQQKTI